jgi:hypothetical protein
MISLDVKRKITDHLGSESKPYLIKFFDGGSKDFGCEYWDLPPQQEEDKPIHIQYQEITTKLTSLMEADKNDEQIEVLKKKAKDLLVGIPVTKKHGVLLISINDFLFSDTLKSVRKEWWELHPQLENSEVCIFQGYKNTESLLSGLIDILIAMPGNDQFDFLRINSTRGNNYPISTEQIIKSLSRIDQEFGISITSASEDSLEFVFKNPIEVKDRHRIRQRLYRLCPDAENLTEGIKAGKVCLWWD